MTRLLALEEETGTQLQGIGRRNDKQKDVDERNAEESDDGFLCSPDVVSFGVVSSDVSPDVVSTLPASFVNASFAPISSLSVSPKSFSHLVPHSLASVSMVSSLSSPSSPSLPSPALPSSLPSSFACPFPSPVRPVPSIHVSTSNLSCRPLSAPPPSLFSSRSHQSFISVGPVSTSASVSSQSPCSPSVSPSPPTAPGPLTPTPLLPSSSSLYPFLREMEYRKKRRELRGHYRSAGRRGPLFWFLLITVCCTVLSMSVCPNEGRISLNLWFRWSENEESRVSNVTNTGDVVGLSFVLLLLIMNIVLIINSSITFYLIALTYISILILILLVVLIVVDLVVSGNLLDTFAGCGGPLAESAFRHKSIFILLLYLCLLLLCFVLLSLHAAFYPLLVRKGYSLARLKWTIIDVVPVVLAVPAVSGGPSCPSHVKDKRTPVQKPERNTNQNIDADETTKPQNKSNNRKKPALGSDFLPRLERTKQKIDDIRRRWTRNEENQNNKTSPVGCSLDGGDAVENDEFHRHKPKTRMKSNELDSSFHATIISPRLRKKKGLRSLKIRRKSALPSFTFKERGMGRVNTSRAMEAEPVVRRPRKYKIRQTGPRIWRRWQRKGNENGKEIQEGEKEKGEYEDGENEEEEEETKESEYLQYKPVLELKTCYKVVAMKRPTCDLLYSLIFCRNKLTIGKGGHLAWYVGEVNEEGLPNGFGRWREECKHGEELLGVWKNGVPDAPFRAREYGSGSGFIGVNLGWASFERTDTLTWGIGKAECSVSGAFFRDLPAVDYITCPISFDSSHFDRARSGHEGKPSPGPTPLSLKGKGWRRVISSRWKNCGILCCRRKKKEQEDKSWAINVLIYKRCRKLRMQRKLLWRNAEWVAAELRKHGQFPSFGRQPCVNLNIGVDTDRGLHVSGHVSTGSLALLRHLSSSTISSSSHLSSKVKGLSYEELGGDSLGGRMRGGDSSHNGELPGAGVAEWSRRETNYPPSKSSLLSIRVMRKPVEYAVDPADMLRGLRDPLCLVGYAGPELSVGGWVQAELAGHPEGFIFIHGYNCLLVHNLGSLGQMVAFAHFPSYVKTFVFNWPCGLGVTTFFDARKWSSSDKTAHAFLLFITTLRKLGIRQFHIMAHSMGTRVLLHSLKVAFSTFPGMFETCGGGGDGSIQLLTISLMNPEYFLDDFLQFFPALRAHCAHITIFADSQDGALRWSEIFSNKPAVGRSVYGLRASALGARVGHDFAQPPGTQRKNSTVLRQTKDQAAGSTDIPLGIVNYDISQNNTTRSPSSPLTLSGSSPANINSADDVLRSPLSSPSSPPGFEEDGGSINGRARDCLHVNDSSVEHSPTSPVSNLAFLSLMCSVDSPSLNGGGRTLDTLNAGSHAAAGVGVRIPDRKLSLMANDVSRKIRTTAAKTVARLTNAAKAIPGGKHEGSEYSIPEVKGSVSAYFQVEDDYEKRHQWLDCDVIDTSFMDQNIGGMRHVFFNLNREVIEDLRELVVERKRAFQRTSRLDRRDGNVWVYRVAPSFLKSLYDW